MAQKFSKESFRNSKLTAVCYQWKPDIRGFNTSILVVSIKKTFMLVCLYSHSASSQISFISAHMVEYLEFKLNREQHFWHALYPNCSTLYNINFPLIRHIWTWTLSTEKSSRVFWCNIFLCNVREYEGSDFGLIFQNSKFRVSCINFFPKIVKRGKAVLAHMKMNHNKQRRTEHVWLK